MKNLIKTITAVAVFLYTTAAIAQYTKLHDFATADGTLPIGNLIEVNGELYGTSSQGGAFFNGGTIFKIQKDGTGYTKLHDFNNHNGKHPKGSLFFDGTYLYGTTREGGAGSPYGNIFKILPDGTGFSVLYDLDFNSGIYPEGALISDGSFLYGTCSGGGANNRGTVFKLDPNGGSIVNIHDFLAYNTPTGSLVLENDTLYGLTTKTGFNFGGSIFKVGTDGVGHGDLQAFSGANGSAPFASLVYDGTHFYGATQIGGTNNSGTIFKILPDGTSFSTIFNFDGPIFGSAPTGDLIISGNYIYGMAVAGGSNGAGNLFKLTKDGLSFNVLKEFDDVNSGKSANGGLYFDGYTLFGMTALGGTNNFGTIYKYCNLDMNLSTNGAIITVNTPGAHYQWYDCGTGLPIAGAINQSYTATTNGIYNVTVSIDGCEDVSVCEPITTVGINENELMKIHFFPNPITNTLNVQSETIIKEISIIDINGRIVLNQEVDSKNSLNLDVSTLNNGIYFLKVMDVEGSLSVQKIIKQ